MGLAIGIGADVRLVGDIAQGVVGDGDDVGPRAGRGVDLGHPVEGVVDEALGQALHHVLALGQVAEGVEAVVEVLEHHGAGGIGGIDRVEEAGEFVEVTDALDPVAEPELGDVAAGVHQQRLQVFGPGGRVGHGFEVAVGVVNVAGRQPGRIDDVEDPAEGVISGRDRIGRTVDSLGRAVGAAEGVVGVDCVLARPRERIKYGVSRIHNY